jgi:hypothetical protein
MRWTGEGRRWAAVVAAVLLAAGPAGLAAAGPAGTRVARQAAPVVVDGTGRVLGPVVGTEAGLLMLVEMVVSGQRAVLLVDRQGVVGTVHALAYQSNNCGGTPYLVTRGEDAPLYDLVALGPGNVLYRANGPPLTLLIASTLTFTGCLSQVPQDVQVYPAVNFADVDTLDPPITPPLSLGP